MNCLLFINDLIFATVLRVNTVCSYICSIVLVEHNLSLIVKGSHSDMIIIT